MKGRALTVVLTAFATLHLVVAAAPAVVLAVVARKGGLTWAYGIDLVGASVVLGALHGSIVRYRLRSERRAGVRFADAWIAELDALVVLAASVTGLLYLVLGGFAPEHAAIVNRGWEVVWLWIGVLLAAIGVAELTRSVVLRWLQRDGTDGSRRGVAGYPRPPMSGPVTAPDDAPTEGRAPHRAWSAGDTDRFGAVPSPRPRNETAPSPGGRSDG